MAKKLSSTTKLDQFIRDKDGRIQLIQRPNFPIIGWVVFLLLSHLVNTSLLRSGFASMSLGFLTIWAYLEITQGASYFRRVLGILVASLVVFNFFVR
jgi:hypothetical protein